MNLFILRHGEAETFADSDALRQLTARGRNDVAAVTQKMKNELAPITHVYISPYVRAQQTAEIVLSLIGERPSTTTELITPDADPQQVLDLLNTSDAENVLLVSHQPLVGELVNGLTGHPDGFYSMGTSSLAKISLDLTAKNSGELDWLK